MSAAAAPAQPPANVRSAARMQPEKTAGPGRDAALALSLANLCFLGRWRNLLYSPAFYMPAWSWADYLGLILDVLLLAALFWLLLRLGRRGAPGLDALPLLAYVALASALWEHLGDRADQVVGSRTALLAGAAVSMAAVVTVVRWKSAAVRLAEGTALVLLAFVPVAFAQGLWKMAHSEPPSLPLATAGADKPAQRRVVWIIYDEFDQRLGFGEPMAGLRLRNLERLQTQAIQASDAVQSGLDTGRAMPSLLLGRQVFASLPQGRDSMRVELAPGGPEEDFAALPNIFTRAREAGIRTALVGWYLPYCRLLTPDDCYAEPKDASNSGPPRLLGSMAAHLRELPPARERRRHIRNYLRLLQEGKRIAADPLVGLAIIHLPVPHGPGIYDARRSRLSLLEFGDDWYAGNLALADQALGELRQAIESAGLEERTALIVTSDHGLRWLRGWHESTDPRVPFLVKPAGDSQPAAFEQRFSTVVAHDLALALLAGELRTSDDVLRWLEQRVTSSDTNPPSR